MKKTIKINEQISASSVKVISDKGEFLGIMQIQEALNLAKEKEMDLVEIISNPVEPLCKICSATSLIAEKKKKQKIIKKNTKTTSFKELRIRYVISKHDLEIKIKQAIKFLEKGHNITLSMRFRGREKLHLEQGKNLLMNAIESLKEFGTPQNTNLNLLGNQIIIKIETNKKS